MNCVNIKSRDFIHLAKRLNLSSNTLELIIHKYQAETGFDTAFPSDVYIQAQLGKDQYIEPSKAVRDLWEASYNTPQSFNSLQEYQRKYEEVKNYFPNEALVHYKDNENKDVLAVKKPVKELRPTINDYLDSNSHTKQEWDDYDFITRQLAANLKNNNNFAVANKIREQYVNDRKTEEGNTTFSHFDLKKPIKLKEKGIAADLKAIQANEWHLPEDIQKTVADKLQKYMDDKSGEIQEVDTVPYFGEKGKTNAKDILTYITKNSTDKDIRTLASFVLKNLGKNENVPVSFSNNTRGSRGKYYTNSHSVRISKVSMTGNDVASATNNMEQTIIHEIAHAISVRAIETSPEIRKELLQIFKDYNQLKSQYGINTGYAAKNPKEFLAEFLGRKAFREALMALPSIGQENKKTKQTIGQRILNWLKNVLHIGNKSSFFKQADEVIQKVLDQANSQEFFYTDEMEAAAEDRNPQPFTFNDGTVITAPFAPNKQQADALNAMNDFLNSNETTMTLSGYAGTGKTSLMEIIAQKARRQHKDIVFSATTNKAAAVLKSRVAKAGFDAQTLNKVFGINVEVDSSKAYNARNLVTALKEANVEPGTTVVIDEASMINEENYSILNRVARENSLKIIYVGDKAQLAPVNENQVSKVFRNSEGRIIELTKVERTDDNAILKEATNIRNGLPLSGESSFNERGEGVGYLTPKSREEVGRVIRHYIQGLKDNPNFFRILAYTNKAVTDYNNYVRSLLGYNDYVPHVGEPLTGYSNWGYEWRTKSYRFINSESYKVTKVGRPQTSSISINGENYTMQYVPITMENSLGETDTFNYMDVKGNQENRKAALQLATQKKTLWEQYRRAVGREAKSDILSQINSIDQFLFVNDNIEDPTTHNLLQPKTVDFGYALTIHKSQGSTFTHVLMDDIDVAKAGNTLNNAANAEDVYIGKDQWGASMDNMQGEAEEVDMGITEYDLNPAKYANPTTTTNNPNVANVRQQLEYVGVSRATNTVTIVATNASVKKEDSPLNHVKSSTNTTSSTDSQPVAIENTPKPADQMGKKELWEHLESLTEPIGERPVSYTPVGKTRQEYIVKDGKVYNKKGEEVHYQGKDMNKILANLAVAEDRGVVVTYRNNDYVVDNHQNITSVQTGDIMKWGPQDGNRKTVIQLAEQKFQTLIKNRQNRLSEMVPELMDLLKAQSINVNDKAAMEKFLKENPQWSTKIQQIIEENREMQSIKERAIADGTFMKAPNGNPTNLTERQWLQVRTKNFINWFGDWVNDPDSASKVVDENGEPKVMYHATPWGKFSIFKQFQPNTGDRTKAGELYFGNSERMVQRYKRGEFNKGNSSPEVYAVFLNIRNPYKNAEVINKQQLDDILEDLKNYLTPKEFESIQNKVYDDWNTDEKYNFQYHSYNVYNTLANYFKNNNKDRFYEVVRNLRNSGHKDGMFFLTKEEWEGQPINFREGIKRQVWVMDPNQIKSATDNNGMFSTENDDIQMFIGKKARTQFEQQLMKARPDMATPGYTVDGIDFVKDPFSDDFIPNRLDVVTAQRLQKEGIIKEGVFSAWALTDKGKEMAQVSHPEIDAVLNFLHSLEDNKENTAYIKTAIRWIANRSLTLPQDHTKAYQAFELARKKHLDLQKYNTLGELITAPEMQPKKKEKVPFNPDKARTFSNKRTVTTKGGRVFTVYDVENTEEGQREVCKALAAHYEMSPWCLSTFTATGEPTESAKNYWNLYKALPRKIAFENGKPVAFNSDKYGRGIAETVFRGTPVIVQGEEAIIDSTERGHLSRVTIDAWKQGGLVTESKIVPNALRLTEEAKKEIYNITGESWWDMEDTHPQDTLSDSIVSEPRKYESELPDGVQLENDDFQADWENMADLYDETEFGFGRPGGNQHPFTREEIDELPFMQTSEGDIYGFADPKGDLYFDEEKVSPNVQIHEYTHLWDRAVAQRNPKLWKRGVDLMKQTSLWNEVLNDANYGQKWQAVKGITSEKMESLIASEVHSRLTGTQGEALFNRIAKDKGSKGIIAKLKQWMLDFWKELKGTFSNWSDEEINKLTLDDFNKMTVRDLVDKVNLKEQQSTQQQVVGENISSKGSAFAKRLTNPFNNETVEFRGTKFDNAEHAYQTWKSGKFDQRGFDAHGGKVKGTTDYSSNYQTMVEILTAKLQQHPDLVEGIAERGGEAYLKASTHDVVGDKYWETKTGQNKFIEALTEAYKSVTPQQSQQQNIPASYEGMITPDANTTKEGKYTLDFVNKTVTPDYRPTRTIKDIPFLEKEISVFQNLGTRGELNKTIPYREYAKLEETVQQLNNGNKSWKLTSFLHKIYGVEELNGLWEYNKETKSIKTNNWIYSLYTLLKEKPEDFYNTLNFLYDTALLDYNHQLEDAINSIVKEDSEVIEKLNYIKNNPSKGSSNTVFVFGSNPKGIHGAGAAAVATTQFGAERGIGEGITGNAYALPTKDLDKAKGTRWYRPGKKEETEVKEWYKNHNYSEVQNHPLNAERTMTPQQIIESIKKFYEVARQNPKKQFKVSHYPFGQLSLNGYLGEEMLAMFKQAGEVPSNVQFNKEWANHWNDNAFNATNQQVPISEVSPSEQSPQRVSLLSYEYFMDKTEDTLVDAAWKVPMLQELDKQISTELTPEENNDILDRMTRILEAKNQEDLLNLLSDEPKTNEKVEQNLTEFEKMTQQINNLLDSNIISASEIRHVAELVVNSISDTITILQKEEGTAEKFFPNIQTDLDFKSASRKEIVEAIGINNLIHRAKQQFDPEQNDYEDFDTMEQADLIIDNWDAIMTLAADTFSMNEGFGIMRNYDKGGFAITQNSTVDFDNFNDYSNDPDAMAESEKDEQEYWQVEQRTIDILNSMSQRVRLALHECYQMDREGNKVMSKWGIAERINPRKAVNSILRWTQGSLTLEDMINKMQGKATQNPWLNQLIERLSDKSGNETDFQSQFFGIFSKHLQPYSVVLLEDGKYHSIPVNSHPVLSEALQTITTQYKIGEHPLFTDRGINRKLLGSDSTTNAKAPFNLHQALTVLHLIQDRLQHGEQLDNDMSKEAAANIMGVCRVMGYPVTEEMLSDVINEENLSKMTTSLGFIVGSLDAAREEQFRNAGTPNAKVYNPFAFKSENGIAGSLRNFLTPITDTLEDTAVSAFYDSGKMYQSYVTPSFMTKLMNKFRLEGKEFEDFIMQEYGGTEWFKSAKNQWDVSKGWRNEWLRMLATDENARKVFDHKVELNFNKHNYMRNMSDAEYTLSLITEYFAETGQKKEALVPAWFRVPIMSNKPSSEFIKFYSYRGANYKDEIIYGLHQMFNQELSRIQTVNMRNRSKGDADFIANFDTNGRKFNFLPFLNRYLDANETSNLGLLLKKKINSQEALTAEEEARLSTMVDQAIRQDMEKRVATILNQWEKSGIIEAAKNIEGIGTEEAQIRANLENFLWNDNFASKNILQLTITDIAFYKDAEDLQKRLAQIHAPGIRGNVTATDYKGDRVSDGKYRTVLIQGLQKFKTDLIANIAEVFERKIAAAPEGQKAQLRALKESLVGENGRYTKIDVTDGQAYSSPSSYRKKAFIFGKWSKHAEDIYQKLLKGDYNYSDLEVAFQPLKPFVYTHLQKNMGVDNAPIHQIPVPFQAKNSEYLLIMADALIKGEEAKSGKLSRPNILGAIYRIMEDSAYDGRTYDEYGNIKDYGTYNKRGIDTIQFDSAIKSGLQAPIDLNPFLDMESGEEAAYEHMKRMIYKSDDQGNPSNEYATDTYVHEGLYEDYCLQQEVPEHFKNHSQAHGSQIRMIIPSDLDFYKNPNADHNDPNNQVFYEWTEPDGTKKKLRADEFRREYEQTIADNIRESIDQLSQELHINSENKKERNIALSKILQREILSSPRYGIDLIQACSIDKETGEFRIPKGDPIQAKRIEQLINSIIKNRVNKQKIAGGPIVQVTNFGTSRQLHIRFNSKEGGLLMTREEYEKNPQKKEMSQTDKFNARYGRKTASGNMTYEEYVKQNQAGIAYFEVFIPMWANEIFEKFSNEDGSINMEALEATDPELLKMISYRIPTEDKYSCAPMKAVGFMPREAGDAIMFPYELTEIDDSDFDVDKRYVMRKDIPIVRKPKHIIHKELFDIVEESYKKQHGGKELPANIASEIEVFLDSPDTMRSKSTFTKWLYSQYQKVAYTTNAPTSGRKYRDNKIVDMTWAVLTNEMTADKILNPGGFDVFKRAGYMVAAYKNPANNYSWGQLQQMPIDKLNELSYTDKDLTWLDTQIQFYKQNAAASSLIGVFAVNKVAHATLESNDYYLAVNEICGDEPFIIAGTEFGGRMKIDPSHDSEGNLIGKTIGAGVSASADAAKTPVLNLMNINMTTAGIFNTLLRLGMAPNDASLFMSQEVIERVLNEFNRENLTNYKPLSTIIGEHISNLRDKYKITDSSNINTEPLSREELVEGLTPEEHEVIDYKVLLAFQKVRSLVDAIRKPTFATRFNSISSAVGPLIIDNLIMEHKMEQFRDVASENGTHFYDSEGNNVDIDDIFYDHPILREFSRTVDIAKVMFSDMPAGSTGFRELLATLPEGLSDKVYNDKKLLDNLSNFYQSYLLIASHMVNPANLKRFIDGFPKYFNDQKFKEKYADNALIQAIRMNVSKRTGRPFLSINITGIDESQKEVYRSAWIDLHKDNPELSKQLFEYCFFRAGVGFSPKTFMSLVPTYVKERLSKDLGNGSQTTYVDTYRRFPSVNPNVVLDQWVRNNWDNNKLVPKKGGEGTHYIVDLKRGTLVARDPKDMADLQDCAYIKTRHNGQTYLWKQIIADKTAVNYVMVKPLGNNAEYLEMSLSDITKPMSETKETIEDMQESELQTVSPAEADAAETSTVDNTTDSEKAKQVAELADLIQKQNPKFNKAQAMNQIERMKEKPDLYAGFLVNVYKQKGLNLNKQEALAEFKKLC